MMWGIHGEHNLFIINASRLDSGNYECQVAPRKNNPFLRASANLLVMGT